MKKIFLCIFASLICCNIMAEGKYSETKAVAMARMANQVYSNHVEDSLNRLTEAKKAKNTKAIIAEITTLSWLKYKKTYPAIIPLFDYLTYDKEVVLAVSLAAVRMNMKSAIGPLKSLAENADRDIRLTAINALSRLKVLGTDLKTPLLLDVEGAVRASAIIKISVDDQHELGSALVDLLDHDPSPLVRKMAAYALGDLGSKAFGQDLANALSDANPGVRAYAAISLKRIEYKPAIRKLLFALEANVAGEYINNTLVSLSGEDFGFRSGDNIILRKKAVDRGFKWLTSHSDVLKED